MIAELLPALPDDSIEANILAEAAGAAVSWVGAPDGPGGVGRGVTESRRLENTAEEAVVLLAQGSLRQYDRVLNNEFVRQDDGLPSELQAAMWRLGRLYIEEGKEDRAACIHDVLDRARYRFDAPEWWLGIFQKPTFRFRQAILIDSVLNVPTPDCAVIANLAGAFGEDNLLEYRFHARLHEAADRFGRHRDSAYTAIRELLGRRSLICEREFAAWLIEHRLTPLQQTIIEEFFQSVPELWLLDGRAHRCANCGTLMRPHPDKARFPEGHCPIRQCNGKHPHRVGERLDPMLGLHVARPQILVYWTGPAIDDLSIYDEAKRRGLEADLYPETDLCDVAIGGRAIGIDAKSYSSPVSLALRLNRSIGGLMHYRRRIIAVGDELLDINPDYIATVRSCLDKRGSPSTLEILPVSAVINALGDGARAQQA